MLSERDSVLSRLGKCKLITMIFNYSLYRTNARINILKVYEVSFGSKKHFFVLQVLFELLIIGAWYLTCSLVAFSDFH